MNYTVTLPTGKASLKIVRDFERSSKTLRRLKDGDKVTVNQIVDSRAHVTAFLSRHAPHVSYKKCEGWVQFRCKTSWETKYLVEDTDQPLVEFPGRNQANAGPGNFARPPGSSSEHDALLEQALAESKRQFIADELESTKSQINIVRTHLQANGEHLPANERSSLRGLLTGLEAKLKAVSGYQTKPVEWSCKTCTFKNKATAMRCEMCEAEHDFTSEVKELGQLADTLAKSMRAKEEKTTEKDGVPFSSVEEIPPADLIYPAQDPEVAQLRARVDALEDESFQREVEVEDLRSKMMSMSRLISLEDTDPNDWSTTMVGIWLAKNGLEDYSEDFEFAQVDGAALLSLDDEALKKLEVGRKHRARILELTAALQETIQEEEPEKEEEVVRAPEEVVRAPEEVARPEAEEESPSPQFEAVAPKDANIPDESFVQFGANARPADSNSVAFSFVKTHDATALTANLQNSYMPVAIPEKTSTEESSPVENEPELKELDLTKPDKKPAPSDDEEDEVVEAITASEDEDFELI